MSVNGGLTPSTILITHYSFHITFSQQFMSTTDYHFVDKWRVTADIKEVADILEDALSLSRWWPSVYFEVKEVEPGGEGGVGKLISLRAGGWLPYTLRINFRTIESTYPHGFTMTATGDLEGTGIWIFEQEGSEVNVTYDWTIAANKAIVRSLSFLLKPIFRANHNWTMKRGEESLKLELLRRRALTPEDAARIPPPPGPAFLLNLFERKGQ
jgi:hypothetical protein